MRAHAPMTVVTSAFSKSSVFARPHQWASRTAFSKSCVFGVRKHRFSVDGRPNRIKKVRLQIYPDECGRGLNKEEFDTMLKVSPMCIWYSSTPFGPATAKLYTYRTKSRKKNRETRIHSTNAKQTSGRS